MAALVNESSGCGKITKRFRKQQVRVHVADFGTLHQPALAWRICIIYNSWTRVVGFDKESDRRPEVWRRSPDTADLLSVSWHRSPFHNFVLKIHQRCNLQCDYCYVYQMADQGWRFRPRVMSRSVIDSVAFRIAEHAAAHAISNIDVVFHGGEPLLAGQELIRDAVHAIRDALGHQRHVHFGLQTNGLLLNDEFLALFEELDVLPIDIWPCEYP